MHVQIQLLYLQLPLIKHFSVSQGLCFDIHDLTFDNYKDFVPFTGVISRLWKGHKADSGVLNKISNDIGNTV